MLDDTENKVFLKLYFIHFDRFSSVRQKNQHSKAEVLWEMFWEPEKFNGTKFWKTIGLLEAT